MKKWAIAFLCGFGFFFSGCSENPTELQSLVETQQEQSLSESAWFQLEHFQDDVYVLKLHNPKNLPIQSLKTSLVYPPHLGQVSEYVMDESTFPLAVETVLDNTTGVVSFALAQDGVASVTQQEMSVAAFKITKLTESPFQLSFAQPEKKSAITVVDDGRVVNILDDAQLENFTVL